MRRWWMIPAAAAIALLTWFSLRDSELPGDKRKETVDAVRATERESNDDSPSGSTGIMRFRGAPSAVSGIVVEASTQTPIAGALISFQNRSGESTVTSEADGRFELELDKGVYRVRAIADGMVAGAQPSVIVGEKPEKLTLSMVQLATIRGRVINQAQKGIAASVKYIPPKVFEKHVEFGDLINETFSDEDGNFELSVVPGFDHMLVAEADGRLGRTPIAKLDPGDEKNDAIVVIFSAARLSGRVMDPAGYPFPGAEVRLHRSPTQWPSAVPEPAPMVRTLISDDSGRFDFGSIPHGVATIEAKAEGMAQSEPVRLEIKPTLGEEVEEFVTLHLSEGMTLKGRVVDHNGTPVPGARVRAGRNHSRAIHHDVRTDLSGRFEFKNIDANATYWFTAESRGYPVTTREGVIPTEEGVELSVVPYGGVRGTIKEGDSIDSVVVTIERFRPSGVGSFSVPKISTRYSAKNGTFEVPTLAPGDYELAVSAPGAGEARLHVSVPAGQWASVVAALTP